ncbi:uncharacterized protein PgNI_07350 [Pyricularia grisea]|uniref:Beta-lactamase-related domain-containing protein n=1 Tax=Pyricularia grisea TaxID=148305 RepID=A0A6P8B1H1_PYRGI|nr:uncharacterized protein PgNI_07350 [Pyricularia grisea]TLD08573.1 hypothetical protein PgNI_07350 [Pyricularia grisea]
MTLKLMRPSMTRRWLRHKSFGSDSRSGVGEPWGVHSTYQYVTTFNKASQIGNYGIVLSMVPELGIRINIAAACNFSANINMALADTLANSSIQPLLDVANRTYGGWYRHQTLSSSLLVTGHPVNPGLEISSWAVHDRLGDLDLALRDHALDQFLFELNSEEEFVGVCNPALRITLEHVGWDVGVGGGGVAPIAPPTVENETWSNTRLRTS